MTTEECLAWLRTRGIGLDTRYAPPQCLVYQPGRPHHRFWTIPDRAAGIPSFVTDLLDGLGRWTHCVVWPRGGVWPAVYIGRPNERFRAVILCGAGIPAGYEGAVRFTAAEEDKLVTVVFAHLVFGDDVFVIPDHGRHLIQTDDHDVVHALFAEESMIEPFVRHMADEGHNLPDERPDETFKQPDWMT